MTERFTHGLVADVLAVLDQHGYTRPADEHDCNVALGRSVATIATAVRVYEGDELHVGA